MADDTVNVVIMVEAVHDMHLSKLLEICVKQVYVNYTLMKLVNYILFLSDSASK